jgi:hypothetical protein
MREQPLYIYMAYLLEKTQIYIIKPGLTDPVLDYYYYYFYLDLLCKRIYMFSINHLMGDHEWQNYF